MRARETVAQVVRFIAENLDYARYMAGDHRQRRRQQGCRDCAGEGHTLRVNEK